MSAGTMLDLHKVIWWSHLPMALAWTAWLGYGKLVHIIVGSRQHLHARPAHAEGRHPRLHLAPIATSKTPRASAPAVCRTSAGSSSGIDICVRCGRCEANCPARITGKELTPMGFLQDIKLYLHDAGPSSPKEGGKTEPWRASA